MAFMRIDIDTPVSCADGTFGELADVVIDPAARRLTHVVVAPRERGEQARLIAIECARGTGGPEGISLDRSTAELDRAQPIHESAFTQRGELPAAGPDWDIGIQEIHDMPDLGGAGPAILAGGMGMEYDENVTVSYHRIPKGEIELRRASRVVSADAHDVGHVVGFVIDDRQRVAQLVLEHGHLWGKRMVVIAGAAIARFSTDEVALNLTSDEVAAVQPLPTHRWWS